MRQQNNWNLDRNRKATISKTNDFLARTVSIFEEIYLSSLVFRGWSGLLNEFSLIYLYFLWILAIFWCTFYLLVNKRIQFRSYLILLFFLQNVSNSWIIYIWQLLMNCKSQLHTNEYKHLRTHNITERLYTNCTEIP